jgi:predicted GNAT family acetyltransferase
MLELEPSDNLSQTKSMRDDVAARRFELDEAGQIVFADYRREGDRLFIDHVETPLALRGQGAAGRLMEGIVQQARAEGRTIMPLCSYAAAWLRRHEGRER